MQFVEKARKKLVHFLPRKLSSRLIRFKGNENKREDEMVIKFVTNFLNQMLLREFYKLRNDEVYKIFAFKFIF